MQNQNQKFWPYGNLGFSPDQRFSDSGMPYPPQPIRPESAYSYERTWSNKPESARAFSEPWLEMMRGSKSGIYPQTHTPPAPVPQPSYSQPPPQPSYSPPQPSYPNSENSGLFERSPPSTYTQIPPSPMRPQPRYPEQIKQDPLRPTPFYATGSTPPPSAQDPLRPSPFYATGSTPPPSAQGPFERSQGYTGQVKQQAVTSWTPGFVQRPRPGMGGHRNKSRKANRPNKYIVKGGRSRRSHM
jgi:hypothetical protein